MTSVTIKTLALVAVHIGLMSSTDADAACFDNHRGAVANHVQRCLVAIPTILHQIKMFFPGPVDSIYPTSNSSKTSMNELVNY